MIVDRVSSRRGVRRACAVILITTVFVAPVFLIVTPSTISASAAWYATDLGIDGSDYTVPTGINVHDQVSAWVSNVGGISEAVVYDPSLGSWTTLPTLGDFADAMDISDWGEIVGRSRPIPSDVIHGVYWPSISSSAPVIPLLPLAGATGSMAYGLNDVHQAVGASGRPGVAGLAAVVWDLDALAPDISAQEIGSVSGMDVTSGEDINNSGAVVGYAYLTSAPSHRQAFYCEGVGYPIHNLIPLSGGVDGSDSVARAISDAGLIVGYSTDTNDLIHAVIWTSSSANAIDLGLANPSWATDINDDGTIVGYAAQLDGNSGFVYNNYPNGPLEFLERPPGATAYNDPVAINDLGRVVSDVGMSDGEYHSFLWTPNAPPSARFTIEGAGELTVELDASASFDTDGTIASYVWDFGDDTTGSGMTASHTYAASGVYTVTLVVTDDLGLSASRVVDFGVGPRVGDMTDLAVGFDCTVGEAHFINDDNQVAGLWDMDRSTGGIFYWDSSRGMVDIGHLELGGPFSSVSDLNGNGQIVGFQEGRHYARHGLLWDNTMTTPLELLPGETYVTPYAINDAGQVVGSFGYYHAFLWDPAHGLDDLSDLMPTGVTISSAMDINSAGHIVGLYDGTDGYAHAFFWDGSSSSVTEIMGRLASHLEYDYFRVYINEFDQVVVQNISNSWTGYGWTAYFWSSSTGVVTIGDNTDVKSVSDVGEVVGRVVSSTGFSRAFRWSLSAGLSYLGTAAYGDSIAYDINNLGYSVGYETVDNDGWHQELACLWKPDGTMVILGDLAGGFGVSYAYSINDGNKVVGESEAFFAGFYEIRPFLWTPDPPAPPTADFAADYASAAGTLTVVFNAASSTDTDGTIVGYSWNFGDGTTGSGMTVYHTYAAPGIYTVSLVVTDDEGFTGSTSQTVEVNWLAAPVAEIADLEETINSIDTSDAIKQELIALAEKAEGYIESRRSRANDSATSTLLTLVTKIEQYTIVGTIDPGDGWDLTCEANLIMALLANQVMIQGVPDYLWYNGCGPTAVGMIVGYWDTMRFTDLVSGDVSVQDYAADSMIASSGHIKDYALFPDGWEVQEDSPGNLIKDASDPSLGITPHGDNCIADFMHTSFSHDVMAYGQSLQTMICPGFAEYVGYVSPDTPGTQTAKYSGTAKEVIGKSLTFAYLQKQIKQKRPMAITVDMNGDHKGDHLVTVIGYCAIGKAKLYAFYSTWDDTIWWANFELMKSTAFFGIYNMYEFNIVQAR